jgi:hypothetical protein
VWKNEDGTKKEWKDVALMARIYDNRLMEEKKTSNYLRLRGVFLLVLFSGSPGPLDQGPSLRGRLWLKKG